MKPDWLCLLLSNFKMRCQCEWLLQNFSPFYFCRKPAKDLKNRMKLLDEMPSDMNNVIGDCLFLKVHGIEKVNIASLQEKKIFCLLREEHERATAIDDKTVKLTFVASVVVAIITGLLSQAPQQLYACDLIISLLAVIYFFFGMILAMEGAKTRMRYGAGLRFEVEKTKEWLLWALTAQVTGNTIATNKNDSAYICIRNGMICMLLVIFLRLIQKIS